ncbi:hypothetical protein H6P81_009460 [Aristolochia fimbriata]|uniref:TPX2 central domain-containing protein n=1 Tax=Aristolochia fimbriata TaxID=158543 RepID=A0AAV7EKX9_ARIFI|nr:hypothetical protein H6P81_009460 [Aristolochia fimbriata]
MEPMDIDWKNIDSRFVVDDLLERINAPMWVDFSAPDESIDEEAWFCRPDCNHPKASEEIEVKPLNLERNPEMLPLRERNRSRDATLKRRGLSSAIPSLVKAKSEKITSGSPISKSGKKFRADGENENPNSTFSPSPIRPISTAKVLKESIKSSAEKKKKARNPNLGQHFSSQAAVAESPQEQKSLPRLRSTLSARNLFGGKDILNHVTEFCHELKKLAFSAKEKEKSGVAKEKQPLVEEEQVACPIPEDQKDSSKENLQSKTMFSPEPGKKRQVKKQIGGGRENHKLTVHPPDIPTPQVRSCPPTPQRFPSSSTVQNLPKASTTPHKLPKPRAATERGVVLREVEPNKAGSKDPGAVEDDNVDVTKVAVVADDARPLDVFWFLKPCTYLIKS